MVLVLSVVCLLILSVSVRCEKPTEIALLYRTLDALTRGLSYMQKAVCEINIDAVFCVRLIEEQLGAFLKFQPEVFENIRYWLEALRSRAKITADKGRANIYKKNPEYAAAIGFMLSNSKKVVWYPSHTTSPNLTVQPLPCEISRFNGTFSDFCFSQLSKPRCIISEPCMNLNKDMRQRGYAITHQVLFWEMMEARKCVNAVSLQLRTEFCTNVMRDAKQAARFNLPLGLQDLFMEQVGLCGIWGFKDFHQTEWLKRILDWQKPSGCYADPGIYNCVEDLSSEIPIRVKRNEQLLSDGCLSHKTAVALLALVANLRFEAERIYLENQGKSNTKKQIVIKMHTKH